MPCPAITDSFAAMTDLTIYLTEDDAWIVPYAGRMGWETLTAYYERVFLYLLEMPAGSQVRVTDIVHPDRYRLFLHCACTAIREIQGMGLGTVYIEEDATLILKL